MKYLYFIITILLVPFLIQAQNVTVNTFNGSLHTGANTLAETFTFPDDNTQYESILMHFSLGCPTGGCDPWDRVAWYSVEKEGDVFEIARYVTPYGNSNCQWTLDVTEYRSLLQGEVNLKSYIETWSNGWLVYADFEFVEGNGAPIYPYTDVQNIIQDYDVIYGDTLVAPLDIDLPEVTLTTPQNSIYSILRIVNTGHGQGNTDNAAEFAPKIHDIHINGQPTFEHNLWKADCGDNTCSPQGGNWTPSRAGWCPGQEVVPTDYDLAGIVFPGATFTTQYVLENYYNFCSPWNVDPVTFELYCTPSICSAATSFNNECNYNAGTHTQPNYKISIQLISYGAQPLIATATPSYPINYAVKVSPNPSNGIFNIQLTTQTTPSENINLTVYNIQGKNIFQEKINHQQLQNHRLDLSALSTGIYLLEIASTQGKYIQKLVIR